MLHSLALAGALIASPVIPVMDWQDVRLFPGVPTVAETREYYASHDLPLAPAFRQIEPYVPEMPDFSYYFYMYTPMPVLVAWVFVSDYMVVPVFTFFKRLLWNRDINAARPVNVRVQDPSVRLYPKASYVLLCQYVDESVRREELPPWFISEERAYQVGMIEQAKSLLAYPDSSVLRQAIETQERYVVLSFHFYMPREKPSREHIEVDVVNVPEDQICRSNAYQLGTFPYRTEDGAAVTQTQRRQQQPQQPGPRKLIPKSPDGIY